MDDNKLLLKKIAHLEFVNDQLATEIRYVDQLLRLAGFPEGLETIKAAAQEIIASEEAESPKEEKWG